MSKNSTFTGPRGRKPDKLLMQAVKENNKLSAENEQLKQQLKHLKMYQQLYAEAFSEMNKLKGELALLTVEHRNLKVEVAHRKKETRKEKFVFYPRCLPGGYSVFPTRYCEFDNCGRPADYIAEGDKDSVLYACERHNK